MNKKRKISIRKILQAFVTLVVTSTCLVAIIAASQIQETEMLHDINMVVRNEKKYQFLDKQQLWDEIVTPNGIHKNKTVFSQLNIRKIESDAMKNPWVAEAEVFINNRRDLQIYVTQRVPVARIFFEHGESYYLDSSLNLLPLSELFTYYTTIVTNVPDLSDKMMKRDLLSQIVKLVRYVEKDSFWCAQIAQISVTPDLEFELIPVLGTHRILFGDTKLMEEKFNNLFAFYKKVLNRIGWEKYQVLDLHYKGQVVAAPSLPWKPTMKNGISNMDWLKSILGESVVTSPSAQLKELKTTPVAQINLPVRKNREPKTQVQEINGNGAGASGKYIFHGN